MNLVFFGYEHFHHHPPPQVRPGPPATSLGCPQRLEVQRVRGGRTTAIPSALYPSCLQHTTPSSPAPQVWPSFPTQPLALHLPLLTPTPEPGGVGGVGALYARLAVMAEEGSLHWCCRYEYPWGSTPKEPRGCAGATHTTTSPPLGQPRALSCSRG